MQKILQECPTCTSRMEVTQVSCTNCDTVILGRYDPCPFCKLAEDSSSFLESFLRNRGNLKEMERELGQSYWTLRSQLNRVIEEMGLEAKPDEESLTARRQEILNQLGEGEIDAKEAAKLLKQLGE